MTTRICVECGKEEEVARKVPASRCRGCQSAEYNRNIPTSRRIKKARENRASNRQRSPEL